MSKICQICRSSANDLLSIFTEDEKNYLFNLRLKLQWCYEIKIDAKGLSSMICKKCMEKSDSDHNSIEQSQPKSMNSAQSVQDIEEKKIQEPTDAQKINQKFKNDFTEVVEKIINSGKNKIEIKDDTVSVKNDKPVNKENNFQAVQKKANTINTKKHQEENEELSNVRRTSRSLKTKNYAELDEEILPEDSSYLKRILDDETFVPGVDPKKLKSSPMGKWACNYCDYRGLSSTALAAHKKTHNTPMQCPTCNETCKSLSYYLNYHKKMHDPSQKREWNCDWCGFVGYKSADLAAHKTTHNDPMNCPTCGDYCKSLSYYHAYHKKTHDPPMCVFCLQTFNSKEELNDHMDIHRTRYKRVNMKKYKIVPIGKSKK